MAVVLAMILGTSSSHEEGVTRDVNVDTKGFVDDGRGYVKALKGVRLEWTTDNGHRVIARQRVRDPVRIRGRWRSACVEGQLSYVALCKPARRPDRDARRLVATLRSAMATGFYRGTKEEHEGLGFRGQGRGLVGNHQDRLRRRPRRIGQRQRAGQERRGEGG
jgi:hypothetical protein